VPRARCALPGRSSCARPAAPPACPAACSTAQHLTAIPRLPGSAPAQVQQLVELLQALNPGAKVLPTLNSQVELGQVLGTGLFSFEEASQAAGWVQAMNGKPPRHTSRWAAGRGPAAGWMAGAPRCTSACCGLRGALSTSG
jgi:hypothetical protein